MGWREEFNKTDISADQLGYWWTIFAPAAMLSVLMSGIAAGFPSISQYGWGAIIFAGVGAACMIMFAASAFMVSWRYLNPLPKEPATPSESREVSTQHISSRLAEIERGIAQNKAGLGELRTKAEASTQDMRARDAQSMIKEADQVVMSTYKKLLEETYPDEAAWADDYAAWEKAMSRIDDLMSQWTHQHHVPFLNTRSKDSEAGAPLPQHVKSDDNVTRYKTAWLAQSSYADKREGLFGYFAAIIGDV
jgi:hypothetical protein